MRQLSLFGFAKHAAVFLIYYSSLELLFILLLFICLFLFFFSVLFRTQKWGMDLLGTTRFFRQRAHTRNFRGSHPRVTSLATHKLFLFSSQYDDSSEISCCPYRTSCPQKRAVQATRESHKAKRSKSAALATVPNTDSRQSASELPSQLVTVPIAGNDAPPAPEDIAAIVSEAVLGYR